MCVCVGLCVREKLLNDKYLFWMSRMRLRKNPPKNYYSISLIKHTKRLRPCYLGGEWMEKQKKSLKTILRPKNIKHQSKTVCPHHKDLVPTLNWVLENHQWCGEYYFNQVAENNLLADKMVLGKEWQLVICIYIYTIDLLFEPFLY